MQCETVYALNPTLTRKGSPNTVSVVTMYIHVLDPFPWRGQVWTYANSITHSHHFLEHKNQDFSNPFSKEGFSGFLSILF